jgi:hypothetical protein
MNRLLMRPLLGGLACIALGFASLPAGADIIAADGFNYTPEGAGLDGANGGSVLLPGAPGWTTSWSADANATVGVGLTYSGYDGLGIGNGATLGDNYTAASISRGLGDSSSAGVVWMRMLYSPGAEVEQSANTATPFQLQAANSYSVLNVQRSVVGGDLSFSLNMTGDGSWGGTDTASADFNVSESATHMLLWKLTINQATDQNETLSMWLDPTSLTEVGLGAANATISANILQKTVDLEDPDTTYYDYLALFSASGFGDRVDELVIGTTLGDAISQLNDPVTSVPEVSGPVMMLLASPLAVGAIWYRRRRNARV